MVEFVSHPGTSQLHSLISQQHLAHCHHPTALFLSRLPRIHCAGSPAIFSNIHAVAKWPSLRSRYLNASPLGPLHIDKLNRHALKATLILLDKALHCENTQG